jgi:hypothetical protein
MAHNLPVSAGFIYVIQSSAKLLKGRFCPSGIVNVAKGIFRLRNAAVPAAEHRLHPPRNSVTGCDSSLRNHGICREISQQQTVTNLSLIAVDSFQQARGQDSRSYPRLLAKPASERDNLSYVCGWPFQDLHIS